MPVEFGFAGEVGQGFGRGFAQGGEGGVARFAQRFFVFGQVHFPGRVDPVVLAVSGRPEHFALGAGEVFPGGHLVRQHSRYAERPEAFDHDAKRQGREGGQGEQVFLGQFRGHEGR